jgi:hypothetical protein
LLTLSLTQTPSTSGKLATEIVLAVTLVLTIRNLQGWRYNQALSQAFGLSIVMLFRM